MKLYFPNNHEEYLCGIWSGPTPSKGCPVVILSHGLASSKDRGAHINLERRLNEENIATFRFDFSGHGESEGDFGDFNLSRAIEDIHSAVHFLTETDLEYSKVGLFGSSFGALASLIAASQSRKVNFLALKSPFPYYGFFDWKYKLGIAVNLLFNGGKLNYRENYDLKSSFFKDFKKYNSYSAAGNIRIPTFIVHGSKDEIAPIAHSHRLHYILRENGIMQEISEADHRYSNPQHFRMMMDGVVQFITEISKP
jgi:uncharacterized protein